MGRVKRHKKVAGQRAAGRMSAGSVAVQKQVVQELPVRAVQRRGGGARAGLQNLAFSAMAALGFWGLTLFCIFFYGADPNHYLYGAILGLTAAGWSVIVVRRWWLYRQRGS